ncbi:phospholipase D-like domain-containing protein [Candidatus Pelagibacter sp. HIMB1495]|uniref:phospholipase D-like domain-containing protein n=1 Tax=unclassified Candidatus Pelagibacter TaxID=2647897 RepID=UPI003F82E699
MSNDFPFSTERSSLLNTETFRNLLGSALEKSQKSVIILSAYVKSVGVHWLKKKIINKNVKCTIVTRWNSGDLAQGSSDLECYSLAKENGWMFKVLQDLHAKVMLIDDDVLFIGSPNLTGRGMSLVPPISNEELGIKVKPLKDDLKIINQLIEDAVNVNESIIKELEEWQKNLPNIEKPKIPNFPSSIEETFKEKFDKLWVNNFPWCDVEYLINNTEKKENNVTHDLELFGLVNIEKSKFEKNLKESFFQSKLFNWLIKKLESEDNKEIYFGRLSSVIHDNLVDDPKPYRKDVKQLQSNLYSYIKYFKPKNIQYNRPNYSEIIKLKD